jgi:hypothetical protein
MAILVMLAAVASAGMLAVRRNRELNDPWHQAFFLACMLVPAPTIALAAGLVVAPLYVLGGTIVLMLARFRRLMAAMMIPFLAWLVVGPFVMRIIVSILGGLAEAP